MQEVEYAQQLNKRIIPILRIPVPDEPLPADIRYRNWIPFAAVSAKVSDWGHPTLRQVREAGSLRTGEAPLGTLALVKLRTGRLDVVVNRSSVLDAIALHAGREVVAGAGTFSWAPVDGAGFASTGGLVAVDDGSRVGIWSSAAGRLLHLCRFSAQTGSMDMNASGTEILVGFGDGTVQLRSVSSAGGCSTTTSARTV